MSTGKKIALGVIAAAVVLPTALVASVFVFPEWYFEGDELAAERASTREMIENLGLLARYYRRSIFDAPCARPLAYAIGDIDPRFGTSREAVAAAVAKAETVWEGPTGRELFAPVADGEAPDFTVDFVYDERQKISDERAAYERKVAAHNARVEEVDTATADFNARVQIYEADVDDFNARVDAWNEAPGTRREGRDLEREQAELESRRRALDAEQADLEARRAAVDADRPALEAEAAPLDSWATTNDEYTGAEWNGVDRLTVYEYSNARELGWQLAHELGHALTLDHVDAKGALMYYLLDDEATAPIALAPADRAALKAACGI